MGLINVNTNNKYGDGATILEISGVLDRVTYFEFKDKVLSFIEKGQDKLVLDASRLSFCDNTGLVSLIELHNRTKLNSGFFRLAAVPKNIEEIIKGLGLTMILSIFDTVEDAVVGTKK